MFKLLYIHKKINFYYLYKNNKNVKNKKSIK